MMTMLPPPERDVGAPVFTFTAGSAAVPMTALSVVAAILLPKEAGLARAVQHENSGTWPPGRGSVSASERKGEAARALALQRFAGPVPPSDW